MQPWWQQWGELIAQALARRWICEQRSTDALEETQDRIEGMVNEKPVDTLNNPKTEVSDSDRHEVV